MRKCESQKVKKLAQVNDSRGLSPGDLDPETILPTTILHAPQKDRTLEGKQGQWHQLVFSPSKLAADERRLPRI